MGSLQRQNYSNRYPGFRYEVWFTGGTWRFVSIEAASGSDFGSSSVIEARKITESCI